LSAKNKHEPQIIEVSHPEYYGALLPAPIIGREAPDFIQNLIALGHEVGVHGYDYVKWHDRLDRLSNEEIADELDRAADFYQKIFGKRPESFAAPGWHCTAQSLYLLKEKEFLYSSDTRGVSPFFPQVEGERIPLLQIPTTLPTMDEMLGVDGLDAPGFYKMILSRVKEGLLNVLTIHGEVEGRRMLFHFEIFLKEAKERGIRFVRLCDEAKYLLEERNRIPYCKVFRGRLPGRAGFVSCQLPLTTG